MFDDSYEYNEDKYTEEDEGAIGRCEECGILIYEDDYAAYVDDDGNYFCSIECALRNHGIRSVDDLL